MILDAGVMSKFNSLVRRNIKISAKEGLLGLVAILSTSKTKKLAKEMVDMVTIAKLVQLLSSSDSVCVDCSLRLLDIASKDHIQQEVDAKIHEGLFRVLKTPFSDQMSILETCSMLLRKIIEFRPSLVSTRQVIDEALIPHLIKLLKASSVEIVQTGLAIFLIHIAKGASEDNKSLVKETDFLSTLVKLQYSSVGAVAKSAITCLEHIASIKSNFSVETNDPVAWGEYCVLELVDSDDECCDLGEKTIETSDDELKLEEQQAANAVLSQELQTESSGSLTKDQKLACGLGMIRKLQKGTDNEILLALCGEVDPNDLESCEDELRVLADTPRVDF